MSDEFAKYHRMKELNFTAEKVYAEAMRDGVDIISRIRLIRKVFSLSLGEAKDVQVRAEGIADSRDQLQERIAREIEDDDNNTLFKV